MKRVLMVVAFLCLGTAAMAGPNVNGTLILAEAVGVACTVDDPTYCDDSTTQTCTSADVNGDLGPEYVLNLIAAFPDGSSPRVAAVTFGLSYPAGVAITAFGLCGNLEVPTDPLLWPASGEGNAVTFSPTETGQLVQVYWFCAYKYYYGPGSLCVAPHPTQGGTFADDAIPSNIDNVAGYGCYGFGEPGVLACPTGEPPIACCFDDGTCQVLLPDECAAAGGIPEPGGATECVPPDICPQPDRGACCLDDGSCIDNLTEDECLSHPQGDSWWNGLLCNDPQVDCGGIPTEETTWGQIKADYR